MEARKYRNRIEEIKDYERTMGWKPMTQEEKMDFDEAIRLVTNLD